MHFPPAMLSRIGTMDGLKRTRRCYKILVSPDHPFEAGGNRPRFDAYSREWKVGIEREMREQMNVRSHMLFAEIAYQKGLVEVSVFVLPMSSKGTFGRTVREVTKYDVFTEYFPLEMPLYLIGCEKE